MRKHKPSRPRPNDPDLCAMIHLFLETIRCPTRRFRTVKSEIHTITCGLEQSYHYRWVRSVKRRFCTKPSHLVGEELRARSERVRSMIVHDVFVRWGARQGKAEKFIPPRRGGES